MEAIKDYSQDSVSPALLEAGNQTYKVDIDSMWVDNDILDKVLEGLAVDVELESAGSAGSITLNDVILTDWKQDKKLAGIFCKVLAAKAKPLLRLEAGCFGTGLRKRT